MMNRKIEACYDFIFHLYYLCDDSLGHFRCADNYDVNRTIRHQSCEKNIFALVYVVE